MRGNFVLANCPEIEALNTTKDRSWQFIGVSGCQDKHSVLGRFFKRFEQCIER